MTDRIQAAQTDEELVRSKWHKDWIWLGHYRSASQDDNDSYYVRIGEMDSPSSLFTSKYESDPNRKKSFAAAAEFTRQREEEIRQLRREIKELEHMIECLHWHRTFAQKQIEDEPGEPMSASDAIAEYARDLVTWNRTLARLQRDLTALLKGWREQDGGTK
jgi:predicted RNase H-like nuclease (RuvC/YqgF family)